MPEHTHILEPVTDQAAIREAVAQGQLRVLEYLDDMLCPCEKPVSFTIFVNKLKIELKEGKHI